MEAENATCPVCGIGPGMAGQVIDGKRYGPECVVSDGAGGWRLMTVEEHQRSHEHCSHCLRPLAEAHRNGCPNIVGENVVRAEDCRPLVGRPVITVHEESEEEPPLNWDEALNVARSQAEQCLHTDPMRVQARTMFAVTSLAFGVIALVQELRKLDALHAVLSDVMGPR